MHMLKKIFLGKEMYKPFPNSKLENIYKSSGGGGGITGELIS